MVHQRLVLELSLEATRITDTIPRLDADEGRLVAVWAPEGNHRGTEGDGHLGLSGLIQQLCTMQLTLMDLDRVVAPGVVGELHQSVLRLHERHLVHLMRTIQVTVKRIHRRFVVQTDTTTLLLLKAG